MQTEGTDFAAIALDAVDVLTPPTLTACVAIALTHDVTSVGVSAHHITLAWPTTTEVVNVQMYTYVHTF